MTPKQEALRKYLVKRVHCSKLWREVYVHDRALYEEMLSNHFGVTSCLGLCLDDLLKLAAYMNGQGDLKFRTQNAEGRTKGKTKGRRQKSEGKTNVVRMATAKQKRYIAVLRGRVRWKFEDGFERWLETRFRIQEIRTTTEASMVINGLMKMAS